jgi:hypothetical protein
MPLLDHFHPPLSQERHWESFHAAWATEIMAALNRSVLPAGYFAEAQVHVGGRVEIDVASFEREPARVAEANGNSGGVAVETWAPPTTSMIMPALFPDEIEVQVFGGPTGAHLVAAIELVSPGNKDRPEARRAFAAKCASLLHSGIGLVIVDVVTERTGNLHDELVALLEQDERFRFPEDSLLYTVSYRPARRDPEGDQIDIWAVPLALGMGLPVMPLALRGSATLPLDLEATYSEARQRSRL